MRWTFEDHPEPARDEGLAANLRLWKMPEDEIERVLEARHPRAEPPELWSENEPYLTAFLDLSPARTVTFGGVGYIPVSEIRAYWRELGSDDFETFLRRIRAADDAFLKATRKKK